MQRLMYLFFITVMLAGTSAIHHGMSAETEMKAKKKIVLVAGRQSHGYGAHEHYAGCKLLEEWLNESGLPVEVVVHKNGWPENPKIFEGAAAIVVYADGGGGHPMRPHMDQVAEFIEKGVGLGAIHYACEIPKGQDGDQLKQWIGGYFETYWSVNPHWVAQFDQLPEHPVANGVKPFEINDEWYYNMRFVDDMEGVSPILTAIPPESTLNRPDGPHSNNPHVREQKGKPQHVAWVYERPDGGRGFGFTGAHWHWNWAHPDFRKVVLNAIVWIAGLDVPESGVPSKAVTLETMQKNQDYPQPQNFDIERIQRLIDEWNQ